MQAKAMCMAYFLLTKHLNTINWKRQIVQPKSIEVTHLNKDTSEQLVVQKRAAKLKKAQCWPSHIWAHSHNTRTLFRINKMKTMAYYMHNTPTPWRHSFVSVIIQVSSLAVFCSLFVLFDHSLRGWSLKDEPLSVEGVRKRQIRKSYMLTLSYE